MRIPHHLVRSPSGRWSFRQRVPQDLQAKLGKRVIKRTLRTTELRQAQLQAIGLASSYAQIFNAVRGLPMDRMTTKDVDALIERLAQEQSRKDLTLHRTQAPDGTVTEQWQIDNEEDVRLYRKAQGWAACSEVASIGMLPPELIEQRKPAASSVDEVISLDKARDGWLATLKATTLPKTYTIKKTAIDFLVKFLGPKTKLHTIKRPDLARWYQHMREGGSSTPTLVNKQSYIGGKGGFFDWAMNSGFYPKGDNIASGHVAFPAREKRARRKHGFKAYDKHQIQALFDPSNFEKLSSGARWASLIGLYTGARASEVGQLLLNDVFKDGDIVCIKINDEGEFQKVKTDVSLRTVPIHPDLLALGFWEWTEELRAKGHDRLFPQAKADAKNGQGNWISKAFSRHVAEVGKNWPKAKRGFHSLRKTLIQELQGSGVPSELRAQIVGHELDDEHHTTYSREFTHQEKLHGLSQHSRGLASLAYGLRVERLHTLLIMK
ncbi:site-specific integrase [Pseudoxanthomonas winnipegensis]|uniref:Site-specific integrase n=1 Tax=Pseudoxanthomonas winnipegensis TaxID=2480810 RepID=A0ABY1WBE0_9GAMM|nr:site-specific integrase [Pseudoxanthomonas winnipegensis]TAA10889.1 site-specific integrase [Pseudoxanthomonas winnipegensis]TAA18315.1 site-specific integrase [Pseudoxanthomonas winnipegensis]TAH74310.1 site-specific integrase [Pseudoxanthomonas winnipegensis]